MPDRETDRKTGGGRRWAVLRAALRLDQQGLAQRARLAPSAISESEAGHRTPEPETEERLMAGLGCTEAGLSRATWFIRGTPRNMEAEAAIDLAAEALGFAIEDLAFARIERRGESHVAVAGTDHLRWVSLGSFGVEALRDMIEDVPEFQTPAFLEVLCEESERTTRIDIDRAAALAELALTLAGWMPLAEEQSRAAYQSHALDFLGNAFRVQGGWARALAAFRQAQDFREAGGPNDTELDGTRHFDLQASLLYDQRRLTEALNLLDHALESGPRTQRARARILIKKAKVYEELRQSEVALELLEQAENLLEQEPDPFLVYSHRNVLTVNLWLLGRTEDAERRLGELRALAGQLGTDLDKLRLRWLEGRIDASLGRRREAIDKLRGVRSEFQERKIAYDTGLVTLELSALLLEQGETAEVKELATEMLRIFTEQEVPQEAEKAFRIFCEAALQETATLELVRRILAQVGQR
jgi:tetratricopeptide (TPR) repeat protein